MILLSFLVGLAIGSFANVCVYRLPRDASLWRPRSACPACGSPISWYDNIPVLSFLVLWGHCRACHSRIAWRYAALELSMAIVFAFWAWFHRFMPGLIVVSNVLTFYCITVAIIDFQHRIIPDELSLSLLILGWLVSYWNPFLHDTGWHRVLVSGLASISGGFLMLAFAWIGEKIFKKEALGGGDIKLMAAFGAVLGWQGLVYPLMIGSFLGAAVGLTLILVGKKKLGETIPFGPFLSIGALTACVFPPGTTNLIIP